MSQTDNFAFSFVRKQFLACVPIDKLEWLTIFENPDPENQRILIELTVRDGSILKYPPKIGYQRAFLKHMVARLAQQNTEIHDSVYEELGRLVALPDTQDDGCNFKHYPLSNNATIILRENSNFVSRGTTGLCSWQAGIALAEWCLNNPDIFRDKRVLELGSGIGLAGITLGIACRPEKIVLTDCHSSVLEALKNNVDLNHLEGLDVSRIEVANLPWEDVNCEVCKRISPEILIAADVVYDSDLFEDFVRALNQFFGVSAKVLIIACTLRNKNTLENFLKLLVKNQLNYRELEPPQQKIFTWSNDSPIKFFYVHPNRET